MRTSSKAAAVAVTALTLLSLAPATSATSATSATAATATATATAAAAAGRTSMARPACAWPSAGDGEKRKGKAAIQWSCKASASQTWLRK